MDCLAGPEAAPEEEEGIQAADTAEADLFTCTIMHALTVEEK